MNKRNPVFSKKLALNLFIEFGPIILFFLVFNLFNFILATVSLVLIVCISFSLSVYIEGKIALFPIFASGSIVLFGIATIIFKDPTYIIFKDTIFWGIFGLLILGYYIKGTLLLKKLFISIFDISDTGWRIVSIRWIIFCFILSVSNQIALIYFIPKQWVYYKMTTLIALCIFSFWQFLLSKKERNETANSWGMRIS